MAPISQYLLNYFLVNQVLIILGCGYFVIMLCSSLLLPAKPLKNENTNYGITAKEALFSSDFYIMWLMFFFNICFGISLISVASPLGIEELGLSAVEAAMFVAGISVFNTLGRFIFAAISDFTGPKKTYILLFCCQLLAISLTFIGNIWINIFAILIVSMCYGGGFAILPHLVSVNFGLKNVGYIHSRLLSAWAIAGIISGLMIGLLKNIFGTYLIVCPIFAVIFIITIYLTSKLKEQYKKGLND